MGQLDLPEFLRVDGGCQTESPNLVHQPRAGRDQLRRRDWVGGVRDPRRSLNTDGLSTTQSHDEDRDPSRNFGKTAFIAQPPSKPSQSRSCAKSGGRLSHGCGSRDGTRRGFFAGQTVSRISPRAGEMKKNGRPAIRRRDGKLREHQTSPTAEPAQSEGPHPCH